MTIPYDPNIPDNLMSFDQWQQPMLNNFQSLYKAFMANHVAILSEDQGNSEDQGKHTNIDMLSNSGDFEINLNEMNIFSQLDEKNISQLFLKFEYNNNPTQYTAGANVNSQSSIDNFIGNTFIPGGFQLLIRKFSIGSTLTVPTTILLPNHPSSEIISIIVFPDNTAVNCAINTTISNFYTFIINYSAFSSGGFKIPSTLYYAVLRRLT